MVQKTFFFFALLFLLLYLTWVDRFFFTHNHHFCERFIYSTLSPAEKWKIPPLERKKEEEIEKIINQPFFFFNQGNQTFVFLSEDKKHVLKLYRFHSSFRPFPWMNHFFNHLFPWKKIEKKTKDLIHLNETFLSYKSSYLDLKEETGVEYVQLVSPYFRDKKISVFDSCNIKYTIDLNKVAFILQKKGTLIYPMLDQIFKEKNYDRGRAIVKEIVNLFRSCALKGYRDDDAILEKNYGLNEDNHPMILDVGSLRPVNVENLQKYLFEKTASLKTMLEKRFSELLKIYNEAIESAKIEERIR
ncbi:MAG: hypothetical protein L0207_00870 [Chlamydiae bacterium]|nr:hypothetical protein [Chlamydiota bacterium]